MWDFDREFKKQSREFDRDFKRAQTFVLVVWLFFATLGLGITGFIIWVIVKLLQHFGIA